LTLQWISTLEGGKKKMLGNPVPLYELAPILSNFSTFPKEVYSLEIIPTIRKEIFVYWKFRVSVHIQKLEKRVKDNLLSHLEKCYLNYVVRTSFVKFFHSFSERTYVDASIPAVLPPRKLKKIKGDVQLHQYQVLYLSGLLEPILTRF
jgi:hypothetical protein